MWFLTAVYASTKEEGQKKLQREMMAIMNTMNKGWMVYGDFNKNLNR